MNTRHTQYRMGSRIKLLAAVVLWMSSVALAGAVNENAVRTAVRTWVRQVTADARAGAVISRMEPFRLDGSVVAYIAHLQGGGYCLCGADTRLLPVYLYSTVGRYDPDNPETRYILDDIARRWALHNGKAAAVVPASESILTRRAQDWADLMAGGAPAADGPHTAAAGTPTMMVLPVTSYWKQGSPYNDLCPELQPGTDYRAVTGCVATTAAQIMYYWRWPAAGSGSGSVEYNRRWRTDWDYEPLATDPQLASNSMWTNRLYWTSSSGGRLYMSGVWDGSIYYSGARKACNNGLNCADAAYLAALETLWDRMPRVPDTCSADFSAATYDYGIMRDVNSDPPDTAAAEAAKLSYHAGIAVGMQYGVLASSAGRVRNGMVDHFRYDPDAVETDRDVNAMVEEIQWFRPVELTGQSDTGGHSWIVCGYNTAVTPYQFLMNMGWGGGPTQWYSVDQIYPNSQGTTTRLAPLGVVHFVGGSGIGDGTPDFPWEDLDYALWLAPDNSTLVFKAGTTHTASGDPLVIDRPLTLKGHDITITRSSS